MVNYANKTPSEIVQLYDNGSTGAAFFINILKNRDGLLTIIQKSNPLFYNTNKDFIATLNDEKLANYLSLQQLGGLIYYPKTAILSASGTDNKEYDAIFSILQAKKQSAGNTTENLLDSISGFLGGKNVTNTTGATSTTTTVKANYIPLIAGVAGIVGLSAIMIAKR